ncbi:MAG: carbohydrate binding domain-containing protein [Coriobacteriales bacterium]|nr:carbohydrate binding domain-containing protein [Coriobacteriales bacterium]
MPVQVDYVRVYQLDNYDENVVMPDQPFNPIDPDAEGNYVRGGTFATDEDLTDDIDWMFRLANEGEATATIANGKVTVATTNAGNVDYSIQLMQAGIPFQKGATYRVSFDVCATEARTMNVDIKAPDHGYKTYMSTMKPSLTTQMQTFTQDFKMTSDNDENGRLEFNIGAMGSTASVQITNVVVKKIAEPDSNDKEEKTVLSNGNYIYNGSFREGAARLGYWTVSDQADVSVTN